MTSSKLQARGKHSGDPSPEGRSSWNPLRVSGTILPLNVLLMAKLLTLSFFLTGQWVLLPDPFLPFLRIFDHVASPAMFQRALQTLFLIAGFLLLFNRYVRTSCLALGTLLLTGILSSRLYFENNRMFTGCLWFLVGLYQPGQKPWLIRYQVVLLYFGAGLNKLLDPDWRSGQFLENVVHLLRKRLYMQISSWLPAMWFSRLMTWTVILTEFALATGFLVRQFVSVTIWVGVAYHTILLVLTGRRFGMFYFATLSSYLAFVDWSRSPTIVLCSRERNDQTRVKRILEKFDFDGLFHWSCGQLNSGEHKLLKRWPWSTLYVTVAGETYKGIAALYILLIYNPLTYFVFTIILALPGLSSVYRKLTATIFLLFLSPTLLSPLAHRIHRNRM
jgi:hypothetical protein